MRIDSSFQGLLAEYFSSGLEQEQGTVFGLWPDLTLAYTNDGWDQFAATNGGEQLAERYPLGSDITTATSEILRPFFVNNYRRCLTELRPWEHSYECSSPDRYRWLKMTVFPLGHAEGLLVVNSVRVEKPHTRIPHSPEEGGYRDKHGLITQCSHCRRVRRKEGSGLIWDWVPDWVKTMPRQTSHGLCAACAAYYYFAAPPNRDTHPQSFHSSDS